MTFINNTYIKLGYNIKTLRKIFGETQLDLAHAIGLEYPSIISMYESCERIPERDLLLKIAKHYRITENELIHGDFSHIKNMTKTNITDKMYNKAMVDKLLPIICSAEALENQDFKKAFEIHTQLYENFFNDIPFDEERLNLCTVLYDNALKCDIIEAAANRLWWLILFGSVITFGTPQFIDSIEDLHKKRISAKDFMKKAYLPSLDEEYLKEETFEISKTPTDFLEENEINILAFIHILKNTHKYSDLGDYYLALMYVFNLIRNTMSPEMNSTIGYEMIHILSIMGNSYAKRLSNST